MCSSAAYPIDAQKWKTPKYQSLCSVEYLQNNSRRIVPGITLTVYQNVCKFVSTFNPVPGTTGNFVRQWHNTRSTGMPITNYPGAGRGTGTTFVYLPGTPVSSVR